MVFETILSLSTFCLLQLILTSTPLLIRQPQYGAKTEQSDFHQQEKSK